MHTFAQKPKATQQTTSAKCTIPGRGHFGQSHEVRSILHLQRTIGNQAVQRMLQADTEQPEVGLTGPASPRFGHDFSRIPIHPPAAGAVQTKRAINKLGDSYEQDADRMAEQVMRTPEPQLQRACPCGGGCPNCQTQQPGREHESLQTKRVQASDAGQIAAPPIVHEVLRSPGQPLDPATRAFMEPRFGYDFSRVRVHFGAAAEKSARDVNARAYTVDIHRVFAGVPGGSATRAGVAGLSFATVPVHAGPPGESRQDSLPARLKAGVERLSGFAMDDVRVHRNSREPAAFGAHAFAKGGDIHLAAGQEQHLPHEAWHVVQQKQGRALATARVGATPVSDDAGLEAEADRMGRQALDAAPGGGRAKPAARKPSSGAVLQAKLIWQGKEVLDSPSLSEASRRHVKAQEPFLLRDDLTPQHKEIHVLKTTLKVLLGEVHRTGVWEEETKPWKNVAKMTEAYKKVPHEPDDTSGVFDVPWDPTRMPDGQPLESSHPFLFGTLMRAQGHVHTLLDSLTTSPDKPSDWSTWASSALGELADLKILYADYYKRFAEIFEREFKPKPQNPSGKPVGPAPPRLQKIFDIAAKLRDAHGDGGRKGLEIVELTQAIEEIRTEIGAPRALKAGFAAAVAAKIRKHAGFFADLAKDLASILPASPKEAQTLTEIIANPDPFRRPDPLDATNPIRERSMAENIRAAAAPLLVQLGFVHAARVAKLAGDDTVAIAPPRKLSDITHKRY